MDAARNLRRGRVCWLSTLLVVDLCFLELSIILRQMHLRRGCLNKGGSGFQPVSEGGHLACRGEFSPRMQVGSPNSKTAMMAVFHFSDSFLGHHRAEQLLGNCFFGEAVEKAYVRTGERGNGGLVLRHPQIDEEFVEWRSRDGRGHGDESTGWRALSESHGATVAPHSACVEGG